MKFLYKSKFAYISYISIVFIYIIMFSCSKQNDVSYPLPGEQRDLNLFFKLNLIDSLGNDYISSRSLKPQDIRFVCYMKRKINGSYQDDSVDVGFNILYENDKSVFFTKFRDMRTLSYILPVHKPGSDTIFSKLFLKSDVVDTIQIVLKKYFVHPDQNENDPVKKHAIKSLLYNGYLLSPPQINKEGDTVIHRVVVVEDF